MNDIVRNLISKDDKGFISFKDFMEIVLYHPEKGYYNRKNEKIGTQGDFYTSSNVGDAFGRTLGNWFLHVFSTYEIPLYIVELGAGTGRIAHSILQTLKETDEDLFAKLSYVIVESSPYHQDLQKKLLKNFDNITYYTSIDDLDKIEGIIFSNELFDAFPVHIIENQNGQLYEVMVSQRESGLVECLHPLQDERIYECVNEHELDIQVGQRMEIPIPMIDYFKCLTRKIKSGLLLTIDYGYTKDEWKQATHKQGSIRGYYKHTLVEDVFKYLGEMDLTTHIHWGILQKLGMDHQLETKAFLQQHEFLVSAGILKLLHQTDNRDPFSIEQKRNRAIRSLVQPGQISSYFRVLIQEKDMEGNKDSLFPALIY